MEGYLIKGGGWGRNFDLFDPQGQVFGRLRIPSVWSSRAEVDLNGRQLIIAPVNMWGRRFTVTADGRQIGTIDTGAFRSPTMQVELNGQVWDLRLKRKGFFRWSYELSTSEGVPLLNLRHRTRWFGLEYAVEVPRNGCTHERSSSADRLDHLFGERVAQTRRRRIRSHLIATIAHLRLTMGVVGYYLALPFIYGIALLPFPLLYALSDVLFVLIYHAFGYRKGVVRTNLRNSFPEKSDAERRVIERQFYRWFCDLVLETLKTLTISPAEVKERVAVEGEAILKKYFDAGRSVIIVMGHWGNWELGGARFSQLGLHQLYVIYHPLQNRWFDGLVFHMRTRLGNKLYAMRETMKGMVRDRGSVTATAFIADQTPPPEGAFWTTFLNQETPVFFGTEKIAQKLGYPIIYAGVEYQRRGYYTLRFEELVADSKKTDEGTISMLHTSRLEEDIRRKPAFWLWSHRRWKHRRMDSLHV